MTGRHQDERPGPSDDLTWVVQVLAHAALWAGIVGLGVVVGIAVVVYLVLFVL